METRLRIRIRGRVQGVFFRASAQQEGQSLGIKGWVRNVEDGSVEALAEGPREALDRFLSWCRRGPTRARVERVDAVEEESHGEALSLFSVR